MTNAHRRRQTRTRSFGQTAGWDPQDHNATIRLRRARRRRADAIRLLAHRMRRFGKAMADVSQTIEKTRAAFLSIADEARRSADVAGGAR